MNIMILELMGGMYVNTTEPSYKERNNKTVTYFDSFGVEHIPKEIIKFIGNKDIMTNIFIIQAYDSIMCCYFCIDLSILCLMVIA